MPKVYNKRDRNIPEDAVYVGRPTKFGNPFKMSGEKSRIDVVRDFELSLSPEYREMVRRELKGKDLVCWCAPESCHADVLVRIANE